MYAFNINDPNKLFKFFLMFNEKNLYMFDIQPHLFLDFDLFY